jgi:hypothetical protein
MDRSPVNDFVGTSVLYFASIGAVQQASLFEEVRQFVSIRELTGRHDERSTECCS